MSSNLMEKALVSKGNLEAAKRSNIMNSKVQKIVVKSVFVVMVLAIVGMTTIVPKAEAQEADAYKVYFTVSKITCIDPSDSSGRDQIKVEYGMFERPFIGGVAVDGPEFKVAPMGMTTGSYAVNFAPTLTLAVPSSSGVTLLIDIVEEDNGLWDDEKLHEGENTLTRYQLRELSHGKPVYMSYRVQETGNFWYEIVYTVQIVKLYAPPIS